ncbi:protein-disulfide reductase DsbD [Catenovulum sediminis]|uniref:Protein-disulfide reductase DsbD n=1 Tax=Catenovulum sediminis TaxID=1740262 RepID=A0ABV1RGV3_9ALTE
MLRLTLRLLVFLSVSFSAMLHALDFSSLNSEPDFLPVEQAFQFDFQQMGDELKLSWTIADGYYLYKDKTRAKSSVGSGGAEIPLTFKQSGKEKHDEYFGLVTVFRQQLDVTLDVAQVNKDKLLVTYQGCADAGLCYPPVLVEVPLLDKPSSGVNTAQETTSAVSTELFDDKSFVLTLLGFLLLGIGLSLTPCVLPMVPILSTIISSQKSTLVRSSLLLSVAYVLGMATFYTLSGILVGYFGASFNLQLYLQEPWLVVVFTAIFVALAFAMFGFYELQLPQKWQDKLQQGQGKSKGLLATYVAGGISAFALSPCVSAPLASALVYISTTGDAVLGGSALFALSIGMGLPLILVGAGLGTALPKSGSWMIVVKQLFGVLMLAMAVWMFARLLSPLYAAALWSTLAIWLAAHLGLFNSVATAFDKNKQALAWILLIGSVFWFYHHYHMAYPSATSSLAQAAKPALVKRVDNVAELNALIASSGKRTVVDLYADWCASCQVIEHEVFAKVDAADYPNYQFLQLDLTDMTTAKQSFLSMHNLFGPPALLIFPAGETEQAEFIYQAEFGLEQFLDWLQ